MRLLERGVGGVENPQGYPLKHSKSRLLWGCKYKERVPTVLLLFNPQRYKCNKSNLKIQYDIEAQASQQGFGAQAKQCNFNLTV